MRRRLVWLSLATTTMVVLAFVIPLSLMVRDLAESRAIAPAQQSAQALAPLVALGTPESVAAAVQAAEQRASGPVWVEAPDGSTYGDRPNVVLPRQTSLLALSDGGRIAVVPVVADAGRGVVAVGVSADEVTRGVVAAWGVLGLLGVVMVGVTAVVTDRLARSTTVAIEDVEETARRLSAGDMTARTTADDPPEVVRVARALDLLAERIEELLVDEREAAADLAHGIRTPLAALRLDVERLAADEDRDVVLDDLAAVEAAVSRTIDEARRPLRGGATRRCDLAEAVRERAEWWGALAEEEGRPLKVGLPGRPAWVPVGPDDARAALDALLGNVFQHTDAGIRTIVALTSIEGGWRLEIADDGPGFPDGVDVLSRGVSGGGSTGLGLDIVARTVRAAGGDIVAGGGPGASVVVTLPGVAGPA